MIQIKLIKTNARGLPMGEDNPACKYPDDLVAQARRMYDQGMTLKAISAELGPCFQTIHDYVTNRRRKPPVRVIARRVKSTPDCLSKAVATPVSSLANTMKSTGTPSVTPNHSKTDPESPFRDLA